MLHPTSFLMPKTKANLFLILASLITVSVFAINGRTEQVTGDATSVAEVALPVKAQNATAHAAFAVTWARTETSADGRTSLLQTTKRYQRSDGLYKLVHTYHGREGANDRIETLFGFVGLGVFRLDEGHRQLVFAGPQVAEQPEDVEVYLRADPRFDREEDVRGQRAIVWRSVMGRSSGYTEEYRAVSLGGLLIKRVEVSPRRRQVFEPTSIEMGEPDAGLFRELYRYPANYALYERSIQQAGRADHPETAQLMRELLQRMKTVKPDGH